MRSLAQTAVSTSYLSYKNTKIIIFAPMDSSLPNVLERAVEAINSLPGIGKKTAIRLALHLLRQDEKLALQIGQSIIDLKKNAKFCKICHNISDEDICTICASSRRETSLLCIVSDIRDVLAIENTGVYNGLYHVLGGLISPMDGVSPSELNIADIGLRINTSEIKEVIIALPATTDGETTSFYIQRILKDSEVKISTLSKGIAIGGDLEYTDELTLGRSIENRTLLG